jgi:hypothetical protein
MKETKRIKVTERLIGYNRKYLRICVEKNKKGQISDESLKKIKAETLKENENYKKEIKAMKTGLGKPTVKGLKTLCSHVVKATGLKVDGTLKKGFKYIKGGKVVKTTPTPSKTKKVCAKKPVAKKPAKKKTVAKKKPVAKKSTAKSKK